MYHPLDATAPADPLGKSANETSLTAPEALAKNIANQIITNPTPLTNQTITSQPALEPSCGGKRWQWVKATVQCKASSWLQTAKGYGNASQAIARQASHHIPQPFKEICTPIELSPQQWTQLAIVGFLISLPTGISFAAFQVLAAPPQPRCNQPQRFQADLAELQCLHQAMQSNDQPELLQALQKLQNWSIESPVYGLSQRLLEDWSVVALSMARQEFEAGRWENAAQLAAAIPDSLELREQAQEHLSLWETIRGQGEKTYELAIAALDQQDWQTAKTHAHTLAGLGNDYWRQKGIQALPEQIELARQAQQPSDEEGAQLSASTAGLPHPQQKQSQPALPGRSRFTMPIISLKKLTAVDPIAKAPEFATTV